MKTIIKKTALSIVGISLFSLLFLGSGGGCLVCDGSGRTECYVCVDGIQEFMGERSTCTFCNGAGDTICTFCDGTGN